MPNFTDKVDHAIKARLAHRGTNCRRIRACTNDIKTWPRACAFHLFESLDQYGEALDGRNSANPQQHLNVAGNAKFSPRFESITGVEHIRIDSGSDNMNLRCLNPKVYDLASQVLAHR